MTEKEHKDVYIACAVGGVGLVLVLLYLFGGSSTAPALNAAGQPLQGVAESNPPNIGSDYNYNIAPYTPNPLITYGNQNKDAGGSGCCDTCGPNNGSHFGNVNVAQFQTLLGVGAG